ncbi:MAG: helix-turn-helix domain-containing protein [Atopobium sp.]|uniref:MarR family transcriptional regulator n=1 Tax=Atopobium sp. TaxID=1872650 RepID=UPI002A760F69|nr:helix-turn-helix domain-containing protein [Atopobium sp.]MDY2788599.1 helix-turn-helix domain-containing protein [Atopobium sp.]
MAVKSLKELARTNRHHVLEALLDVGALSRVEIAQVTKLAPSTVSTIVNALLKEEILVENPCQVETAGRSKTLLEISSTYGLIVVIQVGRTKTGCFLFDTALNLMQQVLLIEGAPTGDAILARVGEVLLKNMGETQNICGLGVLLADDVLESETTTMFSTGHDFASISLESALKTIYKVPVFQSSVQDFELTCQETIQERAKTNNYLQISFGARIVANVVIDGQTLPMKEGISSDVTQLLASHKRLSKDKLSTLIMLMSTLFPIEAVVFSVPQTQNAAQQDTSSSSFCSEQLSSADMLATIKDVQSLLPFVFINQMPHVAYKRAAQKLRYEILCPKGARAFSASGHLSDDLLSSDTARASNTTRLSDIVLHSNLIHRYASASHSIE